MTYFILFYFIYFISNFEMCILIKINIGLEFKCIDVKELKHYF